MSNINNPEPHILVIGAGVCGLTIAQGLQKANISYTIFEAEEQNAKRSREWTMGLHWSIQYLRQLLPDDLAERLRQDASADPSLDYTAPPNNSVSIYDGIDGKLMKNVVNEGGFLRVSRRKLRALCANGLQIKYGHSLQTIDFLENGTVKCSFANGLEYTGTLIVGADGPRSRARELLFGPASARPIPFGLAFVNVTFRFESAEQARFVRSAHPVTAIAVHPETLALISIHDVPDPDRPETWRFQVILTWQGELDNDAPNEEKQMIVKERAKVLAEPFRSAFQWMPSHVKIRADDLSGWIPKPWDSRQGRITLAGDAAHNMPPHRGQGLNHALNDSYNFVEAVKGILAAPVRQTDIINAYSNEVIERGAKEVQLSRETALLMHGYDNFVNSALMRHGIARSPDEISGNVVVESVH